MTETVNLDKPAESGHPSLNSHQQLTGEQVRDWFPYGKPVSIPPTATEAYED